MLLSSPIKWHTAHATLLLTINLMCIIIHGSLIQVKHKMWKTDIKIGEDTFDTQHSTLDTVQQYSLFAKLSTFLMYVFRWHQAHPNARHFRAPIILRDCNSKNNLINFDTAFRKWHRAQNYFLFQHLTFNSIECGKRSPCKFIKFANAKFKCNERTIQRNRNYFIYLKKTFGTSATE